MSTVNIPPGFDFTDPDLYANRLPVEELAELRQAAPIWWNEQPIGAGGFHDGGYWAVTKHKDVKDVSLRSDTFSSAKNTAQTRFSDDADAAREQIEGARFAMIHTDAPDHTRLRKIISRGFTPRAIERLRDDLDERAQRIAKAAATKHSGDFVEQVSSELPLQAIAGLLGVPQRDRHKLFQWSNEMSGDDDPEFADTDSRTAAAELFGYAMQLAAVKTAAPGQDIVSTLIKTDADGNKLSDFEFALFVTMLALAGNETSRNSITQGMMAFIEFPEQWELFKAQRPETAVDEIIRWATPVTSMQRTALCDTEVGGVKVKEGQRVVMLYRSANFDDEVFEDPFIFNVERNPNPHLGFGGSGVHYCIGANLARMTIQLMFGAIADHIPDLAPLSAPERLRSGWLNGIKHWQVEYRTKV
jgi:cholest-4-en-3-one 26-monooxygenase